MILLLLFLQLKVPDAQQFVGAPQGTPVAGAQLYQRTHEVASLLRCPVCQGMAVADSPAEMAVNMKEQVRELLARGYTEEQILKYFELSYGQFVLLKPKERMVWILPILVLVIGAVIVVLKIKNLGKGGPPDPPPPESDPYLTRVRDMVGGDKP
ncbi:MAG TPA: cytochrome c-type biogenesis protein [Thermoanaerobaculia bacterium]|nr:cytochrome c-type biogenesis protein [Thermoanaerobaculia bacterium]